MRIAYCGDVPAIAQTILDHRDAELAGWIYDDPGVRNEVLRLAKRGTFRMIHCAGGADLSIALSELSPLDLGILANFGTILTSEHLRIPRLGFINIHPGLLPENPGRHPVRATLSLKDRVTGVTIHRVTPRVDDGPILKRVKHEINYPASVESTARELFLVGCRELKLLLKEFSDADSVV